MAVLTNGIQSLSRETFESALGLNNFPFTAIIGPVIDAPSTTFDFIFQFAIFISIHGLIGALLGACVAQKQVSFKTSFVISGLILLFLLWTYLHFFTI